MNWYKKSQLTIQSIAQKVRSTLTCDSDDCLKAYCLPASRKLKSELVKNGYDAIVVQGVFTVDNPDPSASEDWDIKDFGSEEEMESAKYTPLHYWVEVNGLIVDITASQFNDELDESVRDILIGTYEELDRYRVIVRDWV
jgi:hypothetical protein